MRFVVQLACSACRSSFQTVVVGEPCPNGWHAHIPVVGVVEAWGASHHQPGIVVLGPALKEER